ncbi:MAG: transcriptional regulator [Desulfobulbaceae bacterium A2]|nr:MAG: transcriptional regulator [Desulfobulbaceae bacterium A2]
MQALTKKRRTEQELVTLQFRVQPGNVERIKRYVARLEPGAPDDGSVTLQEFFDKHFPGESEAAVALRGLRCRENLTQRQLAEATGIPQRHLSEMENGKRPIGKERAKVLGKALNADYRRFL